MISNRHHAGFEEVCMGFDEVCPRLVTTVIYLSDQGIGGYGRFLLTRHGPRGNDASTRYYSSKLSISLICIFVYEYLCWVGFFKSSCRWSSRL